MNLHPYLTPDLLTLIRTGKPEEVEIRFSDIRGDVEWHRLGFHVSFKRGKSMAWIGYSNRPVKRICLDSGYGSDSIKRRVEMTDENWRESFIIRFNEVLHDCEKRLAASNAQRDANAERERKVKARKSLVMPLAEPLPSSCSWYCENRQTITESLWIETAAFTPEQIAQIVNLVRSFQP
jgi:hypothetical protein